MKTDKLKTSITLLKKTIPFAAAAWFLLQGCGTDHPSPDGGLAEVRIAAMVEGDVTVQTRTTGNTWVTGDAIGLFMLSNGGLIPAEILTVGGQTADNRKYVYDGSGFNPAAGETIYFPPTGMTDFVAYYPHKASGELDDYVYPVDVSDQSDPEVTNLLYSNDATGVSSGEIVNMTFKHQLSKLTLHVKKGDGMASADFDNMTVALKGMPVTADFDLRNATFSNEGTPPAAGFSARKATTAPGDNATFESILLPQPAGGTGRSVVITVGGTAYTWNIPNDAPFTSGKNHPWTITVNEMGIDVSAGTITLWAGTADGATQGGTTYNYHLYAVGDLYPFTGTPQGVVFWLDPTAEGYDATGAHPVGRSGKIVSLDEAKKQWSSVYFLNMVAEDNFGATSPSDGLYNTYMAIFLNSYYYYPGDFDRIPIFKWVHFDNNSYEYDYEYLDNYLYTARKTGVWYIPAVDELQHLYCAYNGAQPITWITTASSPVATNPAARAAFNSTITGGGGRPLEVNGNELWSSYWSSTEGSDYRQAIEVPFTAGNVSSPQSKNTSIPVRAVALF